MTRTSSVTDSRDAARPKTRRAAISAQTAAAGAIAGRELGASLFYVVEPDIPEGMTCTEWRRRRQPVAKRRLIARVRARLGGRR